MINLERALSIEVTTSKSKLEKKFRNGNGSFKCMEMKGSNDNPLGINLYPKFSQAIKTIPLEMVKKTDTV